MSQKDIIEIPFGAKDSELVGFEYTIPDGYEAEIKDGKVIIRKAENKDEKIRKWIISYLENRSMNTSITDEKKNCLSAISWLEKQGEQKPPEEYNITGIGSKNAQGKLGKMIKKLKPVNEVLEQKPADKVEPKFKVGETIHKIGENTLYPITIERITNNNESYVGNNERDFITIKFQDNYELVEQKPADEVGNYDHKEVLQTIINEQKSAELSEEIPTDLKDIVDNEANAIWKEESTDGETSNFGLVRYYLSNDRYKAYVEESLCDTFEELRDRTFSDAMRENIEK